LTELSAGPVFAGEEERIVADNGFLSLSAALELGKPVVAYSAAVALALDGDTNAAIILCQLWFLTRGGRASTGIDAETMRLQTGITWRKQQRARSVLCGRGWLTERRSRGGDGRSHIRYSIYPDRILADVRAAAAPPLLLATINETAIPESTKARFSSSEPTNETLISEDLNSSNSEISEKRKIKEQEKDSAREPVADIADALLAGHDRPIASPLLLQAVLFLLSKHWHSGKTILPATGPRRRTWEDYLAAGGSPVDAARAVVGMRYDDWKDRGEHCDLGNVLKSVERWVKLYERFYVSGATPNHPKHVAVAPPSTKVWRGISVDAALVPNEADAWMLGEGFVYVTDDRAWVDPAEDPRGRIPAHRARYGDLNITAAARARIEAVKRETEAAQKRREHEERTRDA
jgi:hypothetical protein